jgi:hypothetical protein
LQQRREKLNKEFKKDDKDLDKSMTDPVFDLFMFGAKLF